MTVTHSAISKVIDAHAAFAMVELSIHTNTLHTKRSEALRDIYTEMLLSGCGTYDRHAFLDILGNLGSSIAIFDEGNAIRVQLRARNEMLEKTLKLLVCIFEKPHFKAQELKRIQKRYVEELKLAKENASARARQNFTNAFLDVTDYRYTYDLDIMREEAKKVSRKEIVSLHDTVMHHSAAYGAIGGTKKDCARIEKTLTHLFPLISKATSGVALPVLSGATRTVTLLDIPHKQNIEFSLGGALPLLSTDTDFTALSFGLCVLGIQGGFSGRLMSIVREKEGLTYGIYANTEGVTALTQGFWRIGTFFAPKDAVQGVTSTLREIERIRTKGITEDELVRFKRILETRFALIDDSLMKRVREQHKIAATGITQEEFDAFEKDIAHMTRVRVNAALKKYLDSSRMVISGAGPIRTVKEQLKKFAQ